MFPHHQHPTLTGLLQTELAKLQIVLHSTAQITKWSWSHSIPNDLLWLFILRKLLYFTKSCPTLQSLLRSSIANLKDCMNTKLDV